MGTKERIHVLFSWAVIITVALALFLCASGCKHTKLPEEIRSWQKADRSLWSAKQRSETIANNTKEADTKATAVALSKDLDGVSDGIAESKEDAAGWQKQAETTRQPFYRALDWTVLAAGVVASIGLALCVTAVFNGGKIGAGIGVLALGGSGVLIFMAIRAASPALLMVSYGVGGIGIVGLGWLVYDRLRDFKKLRVEQRATVELVKTVDEVVKHIPQSAQERVFKEVVPAIQSASTEQLVAAVKKNGT